MGGAGLRTKRSLRRRHQTAIREEKDGWKTMDRKGKAISPVSKLESKSQKEGPAKASSAAFPKTPGAGSGRYRGGKANRTSDEKTKRPGK